MFTKAILELYKLRDKVKDDEETVESIDKTIYELTIGVSAVLDILADKKDKTNRYEN